MAGESKSVQPIQVLSRALRLTTEAMDVLDAHGVDPQAAAYLAVAQEQLRKTLATVGPSSGG